MTTMTDARRLVLRPWIRSAEVRGGGGGGADERDVATRLEIQLFVCAAILFSHILSYIHWMVYCLDFL